MSVFLVYKERGVKMMRPVTTREEYLALRNDPRHRQNLAMARQGKEGYKNQLMQMNYSCLPASNDSLVGPLKGTKRMSTTIGMDIDLTEAENENEKKTHEVRDRILAKKEAVGLVLLERSVTKGYHLVALRQPGMKQEENLKWLSEQLGVAYDPAAKDITRVFYTTGATEEDLIFLSDDIFSTTESTENTETAESGKQKEEKPADCADLSDLEEATVASLEAFDLCCKEADLEPELLDVEHCRHNNLMAVMSVGLPKLMSRAQLEAVVAQKMPVFAQSENCRKLINYFYTNYSADMGYMSPKLREINAKAQKAAIAARTMDDGGKSMGDGGKLGEGAVSDAEDAADMAKLNAGWNPPEPPKRLPRLLKLLVDNYDSRYSPMLLLAALPVLSAHASHFRAKYLNGKIIGPQQYVAVIGSSGSGKGNATDLFRTMTQYTLEANDEREWEKVKENADLRDRKANAKERPPKYHPKLRLFETTSKSSILELQNNLGKNGMLLGQFSEVDGLSSASRAAYSDISVLLRKGWDLDIHRQFYMSDATCNTYTCMSISLLMAGTVKAMLERMFSDNNCEGGLMQRCIPVIVPQQKRTFRPPMQNFLSEEEKQERDQLIMDLYMKDLTLGDDVEVIELPMTLKMIGAWYDSLEERYNDGEMTDAEADLSHRVGEFMLRAAIPLVALEGKETKEIVEFCRWVGEYAFFALCYIFGSRVQRDLTKANELLTPQPDARKTAEPLLSKLPVVFSLQQAQEQRIKDGQSPVVKQLLSRYCKNGKLERLKKGMYRQLIGEQSIDN